MRWRAFEKLGVGVAAFVVLAIGGWTANRWWFDASAWREAPNERTLRDAGAAARRVRGMRLEQARRLLGPPDHRENTWDVGPAYRSGSATCAAEHRLVLGRGRTVQRAHVERWSGIDVSYLYGYDDMLHTQPALSLPARVVLAGLGTAGAVLVLLLWSRRRRTAGEPRRF